jgi:peroxiredoxin
MSSWRPTTRFSDRPPLSPAARALRGAAAFGLALLLAAGCGRNGGRASSSSGAAGAPAISGPGAAEGAMAPEFKLPDIDGRSVSLSDFKGKVVVVNFWATWCPPCRAEVPDFVRMQAKYRDRGLQFVGLSIDAGGAHDVRPFAQENDINYPMLIANDEVAREYGGIVGIPTSFVIDRHGKIVKRFEGYTDPKVWESTLESLLGQPS